MTTIKAIETLYKGYRFRSRLEARWAVFFDAMKMEWEYEKEGYELQPYIFDPDEFKKNYMTRETEQDTEAVIDYYSSLASRSVFYLPDFWLPQLEMFAEAKGNGTMEDYDLMCRLVNQSGHPLMLLRDMGQVDDAIPIFMPKEVTKNLVHLDWRTHKQLKSALAAARSARFEHGENG